MKPKLSVVIATWLRPALLKRCLLELIDQSLPKPLYEIIVVTDGPDPATTTCVQQLQQEVIESPAIHCLSLANKKGPAAARNAGWRRAQGELIVFTDDDCVPLYFFLENYWNVYLRSGWRCIAFSGQVQVPLPNKPRDYERNVAQLARASFVTANCACTRKALQTVGGLDESFTMAWREDSALEFALLEHKIPVVAVPAAIVIHPVRQAPWGVSLQEEKKNMFNALLYKKFPRLYKRRVMGGPPWYYYAMVGCALIAVVAAFLDRQWMLIALLAWMTLAVWFASRRLRGTTREGLHVLEMLYTSMLIPFASLFWNFYGAVKFKCLPL